MGGVVAFKEAHPDIDQFLRSQYETLRKEIENRQDRHFKIATGSLLVVPAVPILTKTLESIAGTEAIAWALLTLLPVIVLSLYVLYFSEDLAIKRCAVYIRDYIEEYYDGSATPAAKGWETWLEEKKSEDSRIRDHEKLHRIGLHFLYVPLYLIATASAAGQATSAATRATEPFFTDVLVFSATTTVYVVVGVIVRLYVFYVLSKHE